jgi:putative addiction module killer protein
MDYNSSSRQIFKSATFDEWFANLQDRQAKARIAARIDRLAVGNPGDVKPVGSGVSEMRVDYGPGYRVYFAQRVRKLSLFCVPETSARRTLISSERSRSPRVGRAE